MIDLNKYFDGNSRSDQELVSDLVDQEWARKIVVATITRDLAVFAVTSGQTRAQTSAKIEQLFSTFAGEWSLYILAGSDALKTALANDVTIAWLDTDVNGTPLRTRLINRLS